MTKKSTRYVSTINFSLLKMKQLLASMAHSLRISTTLAMNINQKKIKDNKIEIINMTEYMKNGTTNYTSLNYELNKLGTDLTNILDFKTEKSFDEIKQIILTGDELLEKIKNIKIDKNKIDILKSMLSKVKSKAKEIKIENETIDDDIDLSTNEKEHKTKSKKKIIKEKKDELFQLTKEKMLEDILKLDDETKNKLLFEMTQIENLENLINEMIKEHNIKHNNNSDDTKTIRENIKSTRRRLESKEMGMTLEDFDKFYDDNNTKSNEEIATDYINLKWNNTKYKENMNEGFKKRTIESLVNYTNIKNEKRTLNRDEVVSGTKTIVQELMFNPVSKHCLMTKEEVEKLRDKVIEEEKTKGNFVLFSAIHNDETSPHLHVFIMSKDFNIMNNQVDFINKKYNKNFNPYNKMNFTEQEEFGRTQQDHFYELMNEVMTENRKFVRKHLLDTTVIDLIEDEKVKNEMIERKDLLRKNDNNVIKLRNKKTDKIDKRQHNRVYNIVESNINKFDEKIKIIEQKELNVQNMKKNYIKELKEQKQKNEDDIQILKNKMLEEFEKEKKDWEDQREQELRQKVKRDFFKQHQEYIQDLNDEKKEMEEDLSQIKSDITNHLNANSFRGFKETTEKIENCIERLKNGYGLTDDEVKTLLIEVHHDTKIYKNSYRSYEKINKKYMEWTPEQRNLYRIRKTKANPDEFLKSVTSETKETRQDIINRCKEEYKNQKVEVKNDYIYINDLEYLKLS